MDKKKVEWKLGGRSRKLKSEDGSWEKWRGGKVEKWKGGRIKRWRGGRMESWKILSTPAFLSKKEGVATNKIIILYFLKPSMKIKKMKLDAPSSSLPKGGWVGYLT